MLDTATYDPVVGQMSAGLEALAAGDRSGWFGSALSDLGEVMALRERLEAETLRLVTEWDRSRAWEADGALRHRHGWRSCSR
jgi:hypothetical protein